MRGISLFAPAAVLLLLVSLVACGGGDDDAQDTQNVELWNKVLEGKEAFDAKRAEAEALVSQLEAEPESGDGGESSEDGTEGEAPSPEELQAQLEAARQEAAEASDQLYSLLIEYINSSEIVEDQPFTAEQRAAFDMKSEIDISIAQEYIDRGGDYQRAIGIYEQALASDPENEKLLAAKAEAEALRFMSEDRFSQVKKGMSQDEVRELLGTVKQTNIRDFTERNRVGWFYRKEDRGAAGVYFRPGKGEGEWIVESLDFDAVKSPTEGQEEEG